MDKLDLKKLFYLDSNITYLNHGSFGACPIEVMDKYFQFQIELEKQPIDFLANNINENLEKSRLALSKFIDCNFDDLVFFPNPSTALNMVIKSLNLKKGDEILTTNHEYGALIKTWKYICSQSGSKYIEYSPNLPLSSPSDFIDGLIEKITDKTKVIFISQITSPTGLVFPVKKLCKEAKKRNILSIIDGAHVPAHINLSIKDIDPDIYTGACHKWMMAPKGTSFLYVKNKIQKKMKPLVISWGWESDSDDFMIKPGTSPFLDHHQWQGTNDISSYLIIPDLIKFREKYNWNKISKKCREMNFEYRKRLIELFDEEQLSSDSTKWFGQMSSICLPDCDIFDLYNFLKSNNIEVPVMEWNGKKILRISIQAYNSEKDINKLIKCLKKYFKI